MPLPNVRTLDFEVRFAAGDAGAFDGYAALFGEVVQGYGEMVQRGAFKRTLREHAANQTRPGLFWMHDPTQPIGAWSNIQEDATGLKVSGNLVLESARGAEAYALLRAGALNGLSIGFRARASKRGADGLRILTDVDLVEISLVSLPAASRARITTVRSNQFGRAGSAAAFISACRKASRSLKGLENGKV